MDSSRLFKLADTGQEEKLVVNVIIDDGDDLLAHPLQIVLHGHQGPDGVPVGIDMGCQQDMAVMLQQVADFFWCNIHGHQSFFSISRSILSIFIP